MHKVTLGPSDGKNTVILAGLTAGDTVVTDGTDRLSDGAKITVAAAMRPARTSGAAAASVNRKRQDRAEATSAAPPPAHAHRQTADACR